MNMRVIAPGYRLAPILRTWVLAPALIVSRMVSDDVKIRRHKAGKRDFLRSGVARHLPGPCASSD